MLLRSFEPRCSTLIVSSVGWARKPSVLLSGYLDGIAWFWEPASQRSPEGAQWNPGARLTSPPNDKARIAGLVGLAVAIASALQKGTEVINRLVLRGPIT